VIVLGVGGNIGSNAEIVERFRRARDAFVTLRSAPLYRTAAIGPDQPAFLNTAIAIELAVEPHALITTVLAVERTCGRDRRDQLRWGPRTIDLDVLVWDDRVIALPELVVPHPRLAERRFALAPLIDLVGEAFEIPGVGPAGTALARVADQSVELIAEHW
jgi:2-amino-4-hydroxy-6-hydroxymethyldihydropteridine diphosphokinase